MKQKTKSKTIYREGAKGAKDTKKRAKI